MEATKLVNLEVSVNQLLTKIERLQTENHMLRHKLAVSARERSTFNEQKLHAANQVKLIINQLKEALQ